MITTALIILFYSFLTISTLFLLGYGLTILFVPNKLKIYAFWLTPWFTMFFLSFALVSLSLMGLSVKLASPFVILILLFLTMFAFFKKKLRFQIEGKENIVILLFITVSIIFNTSPLIRRVRTLTTLSLGNNDVIVYATTPDYLVSHSIAESYVTKINPLKPLENGFMGMLKDNFRRGTPILASFFLNLFNLKGYQFIYLFEVIIFSLIIPLTYQVFKILYKKSFGGLILSSFIFLFNNNLLYILYHDFFGQIYFWGIEMVLLIFLYVYTDSVDIRKGTFNNYDFIIGIIISVLFISYHEGAVFIFLPLGLFLFLNLLNKEKLIVYSRALIKIFFIAGLTSSVSILRSIRTNLLQASAIDSPIGWQLFRSKIPYSNPFEAMGFYSIHNFDPMPILLAIFLSISVLIIIFYGFYKSKNRFLTFSFLAVYFLFFIWTAVIHHNFWAYNRSLTYTLPLFLALFSVGTIDLFRKTRFFNLTIFLLVSLVFFSGFKLNKRFLREFIPVDKALISLRELNDNDKISKPIYSEQIITGSTNFWQQMWSDYFLYSNKLIYTPYNSDIPKDQIPDDSYVLITKSTPWRPASKILFNDIVWENEFYILGKLCNSDGCLFKRKENLSQIIFGKNDFEDSLLINGWNADKGETRWATEKESTLRLVTKDFYPTSLQVTALSLGKQQKITVYLDDKLLGTVSIGTEWKSYSIPIGYSLNPGVHKIKFVYSHGYRPMDIIPGNTDSRTLYVNFKKIALE